VTHAADPDWPTRVEFLRDLQPLPYPVVPVELDDATSRERLRNEIIAALGILRLYTKTPGQPAEYSAPFTLPIGGTVEDLAARVHRDFAEKVRSAKVWAYGSSDSRTVGKDHVLADRDLVELQT
jgi:uncharacterized protein